MVKTMSPRYRYTTVDYAVLGVVAVVSGLIFYSAWNVYYFGKALGGPVLARALSYGLWYIGAPLAATLIRKPGAAFLGETLGALIETIIPNAGGFTNLIYGLAQGAASEVAYMVFRYRRWDILTGSLAGVFAAFPCVALDAVLFSAIAPPPVMLAWLVAAMVSGAIYCGVAAAVAGIVRKLNV